jgi:hypothetical protein
LTSLIIDWLSKLNDEDSLGKVEANWHRAGRMGQREAEVGKRGSWETKKLKAQRQPSAVGGWRLEAMKLKAILAQG